MLARYLGGAGRSRNTRGEMSPTRKNEKISNRYVHNQWQVGNILPPKAFESRW